MWTFFVWLLEIDTAEHFSFFDDEDNFMFWHLCRVLKLKPGCQTHNILVKKKTDFKKLPKKKYLRKKKNGLKKAGKKKKKKSINK